MKRAQQHQARLERMVGQKEVEIALEIWSEVVYGEN
jgi:hypothetical protein